jgi:DNA polymerase (family 10)
LPVHNADIAEIFNKVADLLEIEGANQFRVRAYRNAARTVESLSRRVADMLEDGEDLTELSGIGEDLAGKIKEIVETGTLDQLAEIEDRTSPELADLLDISGLGPKRVKALHDELGITTLDDLEKAAHSGKIRDIEGFGEKTEKKILEDIEAASGEAEDRKLLMVAEQIAEPLMEYLNDSGKIEDMEIAGSYRRRKETVGDLDILVTTDSPEEIMDRFAEYEDVDTVESKGETKSTIILRSGFQVDLRVMEKQNYGAALLYFTGSKSHNIALRKMAMDKDWKINEYGVFEDDERIAGETEEDIYELFDLPYIHPELREDRGEIDAAEQGNLPKLITLDDIRGDLQMHTKESDGKSSLQEMIDAAKEIGYEYIAITDHSKKVTVANGLDADRVRKQIDKIDEINDELGDILILKSIEVDILEDGSLDLPDDVLEKLDLTICSIHSKFNLSQEKQTERIITAMDNPNFNILAHPTGRRIGKRKPYDVNLEKVMTAAKDRGCFLEINAHPERLDLNDVYAKMAKDIGLKLSISTDSHQANELTYMRFGVWQARRGWLEKEDILNTRSWNDLKTLLKR